MGKKKDTIYTKLDSIAFEEKTKVLLVGNGLNLSFDKSRSIDSIMIDEWNKYHDRKIQSREEDSEHPIWKLPFPLQVVAATKDNVQSCMKNLANEFRSINISEEQKDLINTILKVGFDSILTTNYSLEFEKSTIKDCNKGRIYKKYRKTQKQNKQQEDLGIFQCVELPDENNTLLWHIHGTSLRVNSMVMGELYYGNLLREVSNRALKINFNKSSKKKKRFTPKSWIDYFLFCDVHILGFGLDFSEIDIWWLLSYKKIKYPNSKVYLYAPKISEDKKMLLSCYNVEIPQINFDGDYIKYYNDVCKQI